MYCIPLERARRELQLYVIGLYKYSIFGYKTVLHIPRLPNYTENSNIRYFQLFTPIKMRCTLYI